MAAASDDLSRPRQGLSAAGRDAVTVVIPSRNSASLLVDCLASVAWADEIIVVDMFSTNGTPEVCARYPQCRLIQRQDYIFGNVNHGFDEARSDWIIRLDTDERITSELADEIQAVLRNPPPDVTGYSFWERIFILGHELEHGFGRRHYRQIMFRRGTARYPVRFEHEGLETSGQWLEMEHGYIHLNYRSVGHYLQKMNYYIDKDLERQPVDAKPPSAASGVVSAARAFYLYYLKYRGYRDGWYGLLDSGMRAVYQFVSWAKTRERWELERAAA